LTRIRGEKSLKGTPDWLCRFLARLLAGKPPWAMRAPKLFAHMRARGIPVWFMGVNSDEELRVAAEMGATAVLTDRVQWAVQSIKVNSFHLKSID
jgi:hypothetical protein